MFFQCLFYRAYARVIYKMSTGIQRYDFECSRIREVLFCIIHIFVGDKTIITAMYDSHRTDNFSEKLARDKYLKGVEQLVTVLETERTRRLSENALAVLHGDLWEARVNLLLALGGDWKTEKYAFRQIDSLEDLPTRQMQE